MGKIERAIGKLRKETSKVMTMFSVPRRDDLV